MARINLLPWREELRNQKQQEFVSMLGFAALLMAAIIFAVHSHIAALSDHQNARLRFLKDEVVKVERQIDEIKNIDNTKQKILARMEVIQQLQQSRPQIVHLFDEVVTTVPEGLHLTEIVHAGTGLKIKGVAESNARVSAYMQNLDSSDWLEKPKLHRIETDKSKNTTEIKFKLAKFSLEIKQTVPKKKDKKDDQTASEDEYDEDEDDYDEDDL